MTLTLAEYDEPDLTPIYSQSLSSGPLPPGLNYGSGSIIHDFDWSGIGISQQNAGHPPDGKKAVHLISPSLAVHARHFGISGDLTFINTDGTPVGRTISGTAYSDQSSDVQIVRLSVPIDPVADKVNPVAVADSVAGIDQQVGMPLWIVNRQLQVQLHRSNGNSTSGLTHAHKASFRNHTITDGDSGKGVYLVDAAEQLLLIGASWFPDLCSLLASRKSEIEAVLPPGESINWVSLSSHIFPPAYGPSSQPVHPSRTQTQTTRS